MIRLISKGAKREEIASSLGISKLTYDAYRKSIRHKLQIKNQADWARIIFSIEYNISN
ncbi:MAG: hypothetical protein JXR10_00780 [Cyclobacteriaceae bacterium]